MTMVPNAPRFREKRTQKGAKGSFLANPLRADGLASAAQTHCPTANRSGATKTRKELRGNRKAGKNEPLRSSRREDSFPDRPSKIGEESPHGLSFWVASCR